MGIFGSREDAKRIFEETGVDGIMIGRASLGNPWIFKEIIEQKQYQPSNIEKLEIIMKHLELEIEEKGEKTAIKEMRKHISWYIKNCKDATKIRDKINSIEEKQKLIDCITEYFKTL